MNCAMTVTGARLVHDTVGFTILCDGRISVGEIAM